MSHQHWLVSAGEYSDYHIVAICHSEEEAQTIANGLNEGRNSRGDYEPELFELSDPWVAPKGLVMVRRADRSESVNEDGPRVMDGNESGSWLITNNGSLVVRGADYEQVRHVYNDRKAMMIAHPEAVVPSSGILPRRKAEKTP